MEHLVSGRKTGDRLTPSSGRARSLKPVASRPGSRRTPSLAWFDGSGRFRRRDAWRRWASVRLAVDGDRIVEADAPGLDRPLAGLTLLEAAPVGGDPLAVEALAAAIGQVFEAAPRPGRVAVAMSGGVDSAVAAAPAGPDAIGVTLRLWQDPAAPDTERACCSPAAVPRRGRRATSSDCRTSRSTCARSSSARSSSRSRARTSAGRRRIRACAATARFASTSCVAFADRAGADELVDGSLRPHRRARRDACSLAPRAPTRRRTSRTCSPRVDPRCSSASRFPLGDQTKEETRAEAARAGLAAARRRREPGGVLPRRRRLPRLPRAPGPAAAERRDRRRGRARARHARRPLALHAGPAPGLGRRRRASALRPAHGRRREHARRRPARRACLRRVDGARAPHVACRPCRGEAPLPLRRDPGVA